MKKKNKYDAFMKAKRVIESCKTYTQLTVARKYYYLFEDMYNDTFLNSELNKLYFKKVDYVD